MITIEKTKSWQGVALLAALVAAGGLAYWAFAPQGEGGPDGAASGAAGGLWSGWSAASGAAAASSQAGGSLLADARLNGVSPEDQAALEAALKGQANAKVEAQRIVQYLKYQRSFETWQNLDELKDARQRSAMAQNLMNELPDRLKAGEFTLMEAALMGSVLIAEAESDEARRNQRVEAWQAQLPTLVPNYEDEARMAALNRETEYMRRRATAFGEWQASSDPAARSPAKLDQSMEEIRRAYNSGN